jgi:hypothetical protein
VLQGVFESTYSFSLDHAKKHSIAHGIKTLEHIHGIPPFVVQHVVATALGGHTIALDLGALSGLYLAGVISREEYDAGKVAGLERLVAKKSVLEFNSLLHQFGAEVVVSLHGANVKKIVLAVSPESVKERFPKRGEPLAAPTPPPPSAGKEGRRAAEAAQNAAEEHRPAGPQAAARPAGKTPLPPPGAGPKRAADGTPKAGGKTGPKPFVVKPNVGKPITIKPQLAAPAAEWVPAGHVEQATVVETRVLQSRRAGTSHELRYRLASGAGHTDATGRADLWVPLPKDQWEAARRSGQVEVQVAGAWPGVHAPAAGLTGQAGDLTAGWVLAGICGLIAVMVGWAAARSPAANPASTATTTSSNESPPAVCNSGAKRTSA